MGKVENNKIRYGFIIAGLVNIIGVLVFSKAFTNDVLSNAYPSVFSNFGLLMIMVWGFVFIAASTITSQLRWLAAAFTLEKLVYVISWIRWITTNELSSVYSQDVLSGIFYSIYGAVDFSFMLFFAWVFYSLKSSATDT